MAKFIELPYGVCNPETGKTERSYMLVNLDRVISIQPDTQSQFACKVKLAGGVNVQVYRRYDTLRNQIFNRSDLTESYPNEEVSAAFDAGKKKGKEEYDKEVSVMKKSRITLIHQFCDKTKQWFENNPLGKGWFQRYKDSMLEEEKEQANNDTVIELE